MPRTHRRTWQKREQGNAALFGALRQPGSGSGGRADQTASDSTHPEIFLESKLRSSCAVRALFDRMRPKAKAEGKTLILALSKKHHAGTLLVVDSRDLPKLVEAFANARRVEPAPVEPEHARWDDDGGNPAD